MKVRNKYLMVTAVVWGVCLALTAASYAVILRPHMDYGKALEAKVAVCKEQYAQAVQAAKEKDQDRLVQQVESLRNRVADFVVSLQEAPDLAFKIGELANEAKLESFGLRPVSNSRPEALPDFERIGERRAALTFSGGFRRFAAFLNTLERHHPVIFVETFTITRPVEKDSEPQASMELAVLVERDPTRDESHLGTQ
jgi:hypothetical protein